MATILNYGILSKRGSFKELGILFLPAPPTARLAYDQGLAYQSSPAPRLNDWFRNEHMTQAEPIKGISGARSWEEKPLFFSGINNCEKLESWSSLLLHLSCHRARAGLRMGPKQKKSGPKDGKRILRTLSEFLPQTLLTPDTQTSEVNHFFFIP